LRDQAYTLYSTGAIKSLGSKQAKSSRSNSHSKMPISEKLYEEGLSKIRALNYTVNPRDLPKLDGKFTFHP